MDWNMVANAEGARDRIRTLAYLLLDRYQVSASVAGRRMAEDPEPNETREKTIAELRSELANPALDVAYAEFRSEQEVRRYLTEFLHAYDAVRPAPGG